ncbi:MAG: ferredoxin-thioredoxin reductase catalytic domain-containing protein [Terriglobia bacterium]
MTAGARQDQLRAFFQPIVERLGYKFSPDAEIVDFLLEQEVALEQRHGVPFCPCQGLTGERDHDMKIVCPCIPYHRKHFDAMKRCWCGLFVHVDVEDPASLKQIPPHEVSES